MCSSVTSTRSSRLLVLAGRLVDHPPRLLLDKEHHRQQGTQRKVQHGPHLTRIGGGEHHPGLELLLGRQQPDVARRAEHARQLSRRQESGGFGSDIVHQQRGRDGETYRPAKHAELCCGAHGHGFDAEARTKKTLVSFNVQNKRPEQTISRAFIRVPHTKILLRNHNGRHH